MSSRSPLPRTHRASGCLALATLAASICVLPFQARAQAVNTAISTGMTCGELLALTKTGNTQTLGIAILWLDGVYAGRTGVDVFPAGFAQTLGQAAGGNCAISVNSARLVVDVIADIHKQYSPPAK